MNSFWLAGMAAMAVTGSCLLDGGVVRAAGLDEGTDYGHYQPAPRPQAGHHAASCLGEHGIEDKMKRAGWYDIRPTGSRPDAVLLFGKQHDGLPYRLAIDRCSGNVIDAHLLTAEGHERDAGGAYADQYASAPPPRGAYDRAAGPYDGPYPGPYPAGPYEGAPAGAYAGGAYGGEPYEGGPYAGPPDDGGPYDGGPDAYPGAGPAPGY